MLNQPSSLGPKSRFVRNAILRILREKKLKAGDKIASEREFAAELGMNHQTIRRALAELVADGVVEKRPRLGNFVRSVDRFTPLVLAVPAYLLKEHRDHAATSITFDTINSALDHARYSLTVLPYRNEYFLEDVGRFIEARAIRGLFLWGASQIQTEDLRRIVDEGVKVVLLTNHPALASLGISSFYYDASTVFSQIITGLIERGHRRIGVVRYTHPRKPELIARFEEACETYGLGDSEALTIIIPNESSPDYRPLEAIFAPNRPFTAIIAPDEVIAQKIFQGSYRRRMFIPDAFSLAACIDNTPDAHPIPLTAPETPLWHRKVVTMATKHLIDALEGDLVEGIQMPIGGGLIWRESVAAPSP